MSYGDFRIANHSLSPYPYNQRRGVQQPGFGNAAQNNMGIINKICKRISQEADISIGKFLKNNPIYDKRNIPFGLHIIAEYFEKNNDYRAATNIRKLMMTKIVSDYGITAELTGGYSKLIACYKEMGKTVDSEEIKEVLTYVQKKFGNKIHDDIRAYLSAALPAK